MTTHTFTGFFDDDTNIGSAVYEVVVPSGTTSFSHVYNGNIIDGVPESDLVVNAFEIRINGAVVDFSPTGPFEIEVYELPWIDDDNVDQLTYLMGVYGTTDSTNYYVQLGGDALPNFASSAEFFAFAAEFGPDITVPAPGSGFASGESIPFSSLLGVTSSAVDVVSGTDGDDVYNSGAGNDVLSGGAGNDTLNGQANADDLFGGADNDTINGGLGFDELFGGAGSDSLNGGAGNDMIDGGGDGDIINGLAGSDGIQGGAGNDSILGGNGFDQISGGTGFDTIDGGLGLDTIYGDVGDDSILGNAGSDDLYGGIGFDSIEGQGGNDLIFGGDGFDTLDGGAGNDTVNGDNGIDFVYGGTGSDVLFGGNSDDSLYGGGGNDVLSGDGGNNTLYGGGGSDTLNSSVGFGTNDLYGGNGADVFVFVDGASNDNVLDFGTGADRLDFSGFTAINSLADFVDASDGFGTEVSFTANGTTLLITGVDLNDYTAADFIF